MHIVWMKTELLHPVDKGGRIRTYNLLRHLRKQHRITYLTLDDGSAGARERSLAGEYCDELVCVPFDAPSKQSPRIIASVLANTVSPLPFAIGRYQSPTMRQQVAALVQRGGVDAIVADFLVSSVNLPHAPGCPIVLFQHNVEAQIWKRRAQHASRLAEIYLRIEARKMARYEADACRRFDRVLVVSDQDKTIHQRE